MLHGRTARTSAFDLPHDDVWRRPQLRVIDSLETGGTRVSRDVSPAQSLLDRDDLLDSLDQAVDKRVTVISAPAGSGKTSLLRAWIDRSTDRRHVAFVPVQREQPS